MKYMLLVYESEAAMEKLPKDEFNRLMGEWISVTETMKKAGIVIAADPLKPTPTATTVRSQGGKFVTTDGPFAETKEQLGGYFLIDVPNLEKALEWAKKLPSSRDGSTEVRPVMEL